MVISGINEQQRIGKYSQYKHLWGSQGNQILAAWEINFMVVSLKTQPNILRDSEIKMVLQTCLRLEQGDWTFTPLHQPVTTRGTSPRR